MLKKLSFYLWLLCFVSISMAQDPNDEENKEEPTKRPSWSSGMPERQSTSDLNKPDFKNEIDDVELDMSGFGVKPKADIEIEMPIKKTLPITNNDESDGKAESELAEQKLAESKLAEQKLAELKLAEQKLAEQKLAEQKLAEQEFAEQKLAEQELAEQEFAEQKLAEQKLAEQKLAEQLTAIDEEEAADETSQSIEEASNLSNNIISAEPPIRSSVSTEQNTFSGEIDYNWNIVKQKPVEYPTKAAIDGLEGWVEVEITINPAGEVVSASPINYSRKGRIFGKPAVESVNDWQFEAPSSFGLSESQTRIYKIEFKL